MAQMVKYLPEIRETQVQSLGWQDPLEKEMPTHSSTLAWKIPLMKEPGRLQSMGLRRVRQDFTFTFFLFFFFSLSVFLYSKLVTKTDQLKGTQARGAWWDSHFHFLNVFGEEQSEWVCSIQNFYNATLNKTAWYSCKDRQVKQWNKVQMPEKDPSIHGVLIYK